MPPIWTTGDVRITRVVETEGPVRGLGTHFVTPSAGHLRRDGAVWRFEA